MTLPLSCTRATWPGYTTVVVSSWSRIAGQRDLQLVRLPHVAHLGVVLDGHPVEGDALLAHPAPAVVVDLREDRGELQRVRPVEQTRIGAGGLVPDPRQEEPVGRGHARARR